MNALKDAAQRRAGTLSPYQMSSSDFDIAFITPVLTYGAQYQSEQARDANVTETRARLARSRPSRASSWTSVTGPRTLRTFRRCC
jgi:hypothetical protein